MEEITRIQKKLDSSVKDRKDSNVKDLLKALGKMHITLEILTKTRIGLTVNAVRKTWKDEDEISTIAKDLIKRWKKLIESADNKKGPSIRPPPTETRTSSSTPVRGSGEVRIAHVPRPFVPSDASSDSIRSKCQEMLANALKTPFPLSDGGEEDEMDLGELQDADEIAGQIENHIFREFKNTDTKYKNRIRSRVANFKDNRNPELRRNVLCGLITIEKIAKMEATEMASSEMKQLREKIHKEMIQEHQMSLTGGTATDLIKCPKCKKSNTTYNQVQTRSADEPMTTFCYCNECGKRWKFC